MITNIHSRRLPLTAQLVFDTLHGALADARADCAQRRLVRELPDGSRQEWEVRSDGIACQVIQRFVAPAGAGRLLRWVVAERRAHNAAVGALLDRLAATRGISRLPLALAGAAR